MTDEVIATKITEHDKHLDKLTDTLDKTNDKLENIVVVMSKQNVLIEKMSSLGRSLDTVRDVARATEAFVNKMPDTEDLRMAVKIAEGLPSSVTLRWAVGLLLGYLLVSGNYIVGHMHDLETWKEGHTLSADLLIKDFNENISRNAKELEEHEMADKIYYRDVANKLNKLEAKVK